jgi:glycosyltransferase involved in cell wall biosynthesis
VSEPVATPPARPRPLNYSVLILTLNEEKLLPGCLASVQGSNDIVVLDSGSTDRTVEIAKEAGARVVVRAFDTFAQQRNFAQREIAFRYPWVLHLDADERVPVELRIECGGVLHCPEVDGFFADTKIFWDGKWMRRSGQFPQPQVRFVRAPEFEFVDGSDRAREAPHMRMDQLVCCPSHDASVRGNAELLRRHQRYAAVGARYFLHRGATAQVEPTGITPPTDRSTMRDALPTHPLLRFLHRFIFCGGFLEGSAGFRYCRQLARYEALKARELRRLGANSNRSR